MLASNSSSHTGLMPVVSLDDVKHSPSCSPPWKIPARTRTKDCANEIIQKCKIYGLVYNSIQRPAMWNSYHITK